MDEWYFTKNGEQDGPVTALQLQALVRAGALDPTSLLVWKEGMAEWSTLQAAGLMPVASPLSAPTPMVKTPPPASQNINPYEVSANRQNSLANERDSNGTNYEGYGRSRYFLTYIVVTIVFYGMMIASASLIMKNSAMKGDKALGSSFAVIALLGIVYMIAFMYVGAQRTKNLGMSGYAVLWTFVPIMNIWIGWRMLACPEGYEDHRTLDSPGKAISGIWIAMIVLAIGSSVLSS